MNVSLEDIQVVIVGGGEGSRAVASGIRKTNLITVNAVNVGDSGGFTQQQREPNLFPESINQDNLADYTDIGAVGDLRRVLAEMMLASGYNLLSEIFDARATNGPAEGIPIGSIILDRAARLRGNNLESACLQLCEELGIMPILPITSTPVHLGGRYALTGDVFHRERDIDNPTPENYRSHIAEAWLSNETILSPTLEKILRTGARKVVLIGPGSLWGSLVSTMLTDGFKEIMDETNPWIIYACNLATVPGETYGLGVRQHIDIINQHLGEHKIDEVLINNAPPTPKMLEQYHRKDQEYLLADEQSLGGLGNTVFSLDNYLTTQPMKPDDPNLDSDEIANIARHDGWKIAGKVHNAVERLRREN